MKNVTKLNTDKENLNNLLSSQKVSNNRFGLGFSKQKNEKTSHTYVNHISFHAHAKKNSNTVSEKAKFKYIYIYGFLKIWILLIKMHILLHIWILYAIQLTMYIWTKWKSNSK